MAHAMRRKQAALAASAQPGYLTTTRSAIVTSSTGICVHTGSWTPAHAVPQCDAVPRAEALAPRAVPPSVALIACRQPDRRVELEVRASSR